MDQEKKRGIPLQGQTSPSSSTCGAVAPTVGPLRDPLLKIHKLPSLSEESKREQIEAVKAGTWENLSGENLSVETALDQNMEREREMIIKAVKAGSWKNLGGLLNQFRCKGENAVFKIDDDGKHLLHLVAELGTHAIMTRLILKRKIDVDVVDSKGRSSFYYAIMAGRFDMVHCLIGHKGNQFLKEAETKRQPIHFAAEKGDEEIISLLLTEQGDKKKEIDQISKHGTPLEVAVQYGHVKAVELFLKKNYKGFFRENIENALMTAIRNDDLAIVKLLLKDGFSARKKCNDFYQRCNGETPLGLAASLGKLHILEWLVNHADADPNIPNKEGMLPLEVAGLKGDIDMVNFLLEKTTPVSPYIDWTAKGILDSINLKEAKAQWVARKLDYFNHHFNFGKGGFTSLGDIIFIDEAVWYHFHEAHKMDEANVDTLAYLCLCRLKVSQFRDDVQNVPRPQPEKRKLDLITAYVMAGTEYYHKKEDILSEEAFKRSRELKTKKMNDSTQMGSSQILSMQKMKKQKMAEMASISVTEGERVETALVQNMERAIKASSDDLWARVEEEFAKRDAIERDHTQQIPSLISKSVNLLEKKLVKELATMVVALFTPSVVNGISSSIVGQFQDALMSSLEASVIPAFEISFRNFSEQAEGFFQKGMLSHSTSVLDSSQSPLAFTLEGQTSPSSSTCGAVDPTVGPFRGPLLKIHKLPSLSEESKREQIEAVKAGTWENLSVETALDQNMEREIDKINKAIKASSDALWDRVQEEFAKRNKIELAHTQQQITSLMSKSGNLLEEKLLKELATMVVALFTPSVVNEISSSIVGAFQRGMGDKAVTQHEKSISAKVESAVARETQAELHNSGWQARQNVNNSVTSLTESLSGELARQWTARALALAAAGANSVETVPDPTTELLRWISEHKFEKAFAVALGRKDVSIVSWLCSQAEVQVILSMVPLPLSQEVLLSLLQQLACDIEKETSCKLTWMSNVVAAINPLDPITGGCVGTIFDEVYLRLEHHRALSTGTDIDLLMQDIKSLFLKHVDLEMTLWGQRQ